MRISAKLIENVIEEIAGKEVAMLALKMKDKKDVSELTLARNMKKEVNETRNLLYKLHNSNVVSFIKKKDKRKGWYVYYWTLNKERVKEIENKRNQKQLEQLKNSLTREKEGNFFACDNGCLRAQFEHAVDLQFKCSECGELLMEENNIKKINAIEKEIKIIEGKSKAK